MDSLKPIAFLLLLTCLYPSESIYCQTGGDPIVTLSVKDSPLETVLNAIKKQTGYTYLGEGQWAQLARKVTLSVTRMPIREVLDRCFADQPLYYYELVGNSISIQERKGNTVVVRGKVSNTRNEAVPGATIESKGRGGRSTSTMSNENGEFVIHLSELDTSLVFSSVNYETRQVRLAGDKELLVALNDRIGELSDVSVVASNGYQRIPQERATGSFTTIGPALLSRRVSTNVLDRLDGVTSSVLFNKNPVSGTNQSGITIRGRSTIFGSPDPVVVIDNFPYSGDINNLNPDDVESITILKDAAAASIWGAFSGNGVIVITTRKGKYNQAPRWGFNTSFNYGKKPDLYYTPVLSSSDYIDVEQFLFQKKYYNNAEDNPQHPFLSPAVEFLIRARDGLISEADAQAELDGLRKTDVRQDLGRYFYRSSLNSQYSLNLSGGSAKNSYYFSAGYDKNVSNLVRNGYERVTLDGKNTYCLIPKKLELSTGLSFTHSITNNNNNVSNFNIPYLKLADAQGNALAAPSAFRRPYIDTVGGGKLLDWHYRPLDDLQNADNSTKLQDYRINIGIKYAIWKGLEAHANYQYGHGSTDYQNLQSLNIYRTRDLINQYTQIDSTGAAIRPIPAGGILDESLTDYDANNIRLQLSYDHTLGTDHRLTALLGMELRDVEMKTRISRVYDYDLARINGDRVDYTVVYQLFNAPGVSSKIPNPDHLTLNSDRYLSYYFNAAYTYKGRYILTGSARRDESNLFGVDANKRGVPLWSLGAAWELSKEDFYRVDWLPYLKLRVTDGYNGNVDRSVSAYATALINTGLNNYGATTASINNPPNPGLRWERINIFNVGIDFGTKGDRIGGSLEYYIKAGRDLIGRVPIDPTTGNTVFTGNTANMRANGIDLNLHVYNKFGAFRWNSTVLFSFVRDKVTNYAQKLGAIRNYLNAGSISPLLGKPLYSIYALKWEGLDPQNGDPLGWLGTHVTKDYSSIFNSTDAKGLLYKGPANPPFFGSLRNDLYWKQFGLSFNIIYKLGYYFRRNSIQYNNLFKGISPGHPDYDRRWRQTGDEQHTYVPSLSYPGDQTRDDFYGYSEVLIEKGDHIRLQDLQISYELPKKTFAPLHFQSVRFYCYANNIGILWKANHQRIDPDYISSIPNPRTIALGLKLEF